MKISSESWVLLQMLGSKFGIKKHKLDPHCINSSGWWRQHNDVENVFLPHIHIDTNQAWFDCHSLSIWVLLLTECLPFMAPIYAFYKCNLQHDDRHKAQFVSNWFHEQDSEFIVLQWLPQSPDLKTTEHLWDAVEQEIHRQCAADKSPTVLCCSYVNMDQNLRGTFPKTLVATHFHATKNFSAFWEHIHVLMHRINNMLSFILCGKNTICKK